MVDVFLRIEGIEGESTDPMHRGEVEVLSFNWSENRPAQAVGGGVAASRVSMNPLSVQMPVNKASPKLFLACAQGQHIRSAVLTVRKPGRTTLDYLKWKFDDIVITSYGTAISPGDQKPTDQVTFSSRRIEVEYREIRQDGTLGPQIKAGWDAAANRPT